MKVVRELYVEGSFCRCANATGVRQTRKDEKLRLQIVAAKTEQLILRTEQSFDVLLGGRSRPGNESFVRVNRA